MGDHDEDGHDALAARILAEHAQKLQPGVRVRTHVSGECPGPPSLASIGMYKGPPRLPHTLPRDDNKIGVIAWVAQHKRLSNDHPYWVNWDGEDLGYYYAASELVPLEPSVAADGPDAGEG